MAKPEKIVIDPIERPTFSKDDMARDKANLKKQMSNLKKGNTRKKKAPKGTEAPDFEAMLDDPDMGDPFGGTDLDFDVGNLQEDADEEVEVMSDSLKKIIAEKRIRRDQYALLTDASYYVTVVFQTTDQKIKFMRDAGWGDFQDNDQWMMISGLELADHMDIEIETVYIPTKQPPKAPAKLRDKNLIIGGE